MFIPEFELTIPASRGQLTTIEGLIRDISTDLSADQPLRRIENETAYNKIQTIIDGFKEVLADSDDEDDEKDSEGTPRELKVKKASQKDTPMIPFTLRLDDPAGNSFIEFAGSMADPKWNMRTYHRTRQQNIELGLIAPDETPTVPPTLRKAEGSNSEAREAVGDDDRIGGGLEGENEEIYVFPGTCSSCGHPLDTLIKKVNIPYFKVRVVASVLVSYCQFTGTPTL